MLQWVIDSVNWLLRKAQEIIDWTYGLYVSTVRSISLAIETAKQYAYMVVLSYYSLALTKLGEWGNWLYNLAYQLKNEAIGYAIGLINGLIANINNFISAIGYYVAPYIEALRQWVEANITPIFNWVSQQISPLIGIVNWVRDRIGELSNIVNAIRVLSLDDIVKIITGQIQPIIRNIQDFINDPTGYILAIVVEYFSPILSAIIAYGMGTVKYELPPAPIFYTKPKTK